MKEQLDIGIVHKHYFSLNLLLSSTLIPVLHHQKRMPPACNSRFI